VSSFLGKKHSEESKKKMSEAKKGKNNPMYGVCRKGFGLGKKLSEETKRKIGEKAKLRKGENTSNWKGGQKTDGGYVLILMPKHPRANNAGYVRRSHLVVEKRLGRYLSFDEIVHHKNGITTDDRPENLEVTTHSKHTTLHNQNNEENRRRNNLGQYI